MQLGRPQEQAERRATLLGELARSINASLDLGDLLQIVAEGARDLCASDLSAIALRDETGAMVFRHRAGRRRQDPPAQAGVPSQGPGGLVVATGTPVRSDDVPGDPRFAGDPSYRAAVAAEGVTTLMVVPITIGGRVEGLLYVDNRTPRPFDDHDEEVLRLLADHAAIAIRNAQLLAREQRARAEAETANRIKDEFLATLSHELRTPLNAVLGWAITLRSGRLDEATAARALEAIERNARAQSQLIEDLLDISRIVTGKLRLDVRPVEPAAVIEAALDAVRPVAESKGIVLHTALEAQSGPVYADPDRLQQVVWNLLTNAIKFTPSGGRVEVRLQRTASAAVIVVQDTGQGITADLLPHVFDRFRQADSSSTRTHGGLGIGLALVRHLVELQGGRVAAESDGPGKGATFRVRLPVLAPLPETAEPRLLGRRMSSTTPLGSLNGIRVLVVDDERDTLELFDGILAMSGAEVRRALGTDEALEILAGWRADVLVSDIEMPHDDGYALIRRVRALPAEHGGATPAVAVTAHGSLDDRVRALAAGFQTHLPKPVEPAELVAVVASLLLPSRLLS
jgi:signal transduction histidine kinase/CheY-like chemotaxis protein